MEKTQRDRLIVFGILESIFLTVFSILYWKRKDEFLLNVLMMTPALSVILTRLLTKEGMRDLYLYPKLKKNFGCYLSVWLIVPVIAYLGAAVYYVLFPQDFTLSSQFSLEMGMNEGEYLSFLAQMIPLAVLLNPLMGLIPCLGEEFAWRGYLLPKLSAHFGKVKATLLTGVIWGLWHAPIVAMGYNYGQGHPIANIVAMTVFCVVLGVIEGFLFFHTESLWGSVIFHAAVNGIDLYAPSQLFSAGESNLFVGPNLTGMIGGLGFLLLAGICLGKMNRTEK